RFRAQRDLAAVGEAQLRIAVALGGDHFAHVDGGALGEHAHRAVGLLRRQRSREVLHRALREREHRREQDQRDERARERRMCHLHAATWFDFLSFFCCSSEEGALLVFAALAACCVLWITVLPSRPSVGETMLRMPYEVDPLIPLAPFSPPVAPPAPPA